MALVLANRVQETATPNTTVSFTLTGAILGFQTFSVIGDGNTTYYSATDLTGNWEVGEGTYSSTGPTLTRTTIYASSNSGSAVTFPAAVNVFVTYPSGRSVSLDGSGNVSALGTVSSGTWQGSPVGVAYGGTGATSSSGANSVVLRDANQNITVNRINQGLQVTTATGGTTSLTAGSQFNQALVGTGGHTFTLPDATTLSDTTAFQFNNNSTGTLLIQTFSSLGIGTIAAGGAANIVLLSNATAGGTWDVHSFIPENVSWGTNALSLGSTVISGGTWQGGTIQSAYGGTGLTLFTPNGAVYATGISTLTTGTLPIASGGSGATTAQTAMNSFAGAVTSGAYLRGNGTNVVMSGIQVADVPTLNQNTTGTAAGLSTTLAVASGGTGQTTYTNGQLLIGNTSTGSLSKATLTAGSGVTITNGSGTITIAASGASVPSATPTVQGIVYGRTGASACCGRTALGTFAGCTTQYSSATAVGFRAGRRYQGSNSIAVGRCAAPCYQGTSAISIGYLSGQTCQACTSVAIGYGANAYAGAVCAVVIGSSAYSNYGIEKAIVIGANAFTQNNASKRAVVIGANASATGFGCCEAGPVAIGSTSVAYAYGVAVGRNAGATGPRSIAIGATVTASQENGIAIGASASVSNGCGARTNSVGIGKSVSVSKSCSVAIGANVSVSVCNANAIGRSTTNGIPNSTVIKPLRAVSTAYVVYYNPTTGELSYS